MAITFDSPPINEVVLGQVFLPRTDLLIQHLGTFAGGMEKEYPHWEHAAPVGTPNQPLATDPKSNLPLPRLWLISEDRTRLVQLQQDRVYVNWRQGKSTDSYIRFERIKKEFDRVFGVFSEFVGARTDEPLRSRRFELNYINVIPAKPNESPLELSMRVFRDLRFYSTSQILNAPKVIRARLEYPLPENFGTLIVALDPAKVTSTGEDVMRFELSAVGGLDEAGGMEFDVWAGVAHDAIVQAFHDLTTAEMHSVWKLQDGGA